LLKKGRRCHDGCDGDEGVVGAQHAGAEPAGGAHLHAVPLGAGLGYEVVVEGLEQALTWLGGLRIIIVTIFHLHLLPLVPLHR
jgi:hypothetical protein